MVDDVGCLIEAQECVLKNRRIRTVISRKQGNGGLNFKANGNKKLIQNGGHGKSNV